VSATEKTRSPCRGSTWTIARLPHQIGDDLDDSLAIAGNDRHFRAYLASQRAAPFLHDGFKRFDYFADEPTRIFDCFLDCEATGVDLSKIAQISRAHGSARPGSGRVVRTPSVVRLNRKDRPHLAPTRRRREAARAQGDCFGV
jgi:hypothetical protein